MRGVAVRLTMPVKVQVEHIDLKWQWLQTKIILGSEKPRYGEHKIRTADHFSGNPVVLHPQLNSPLRLMPQQSHVHLAEAFATTGYMDVAQAQIRFERQRFMSRRMVRAHNTNILVFDQGLVPDLGVFH